MLRKNNHGSILITLFILLFAFNGWAQDKYYNREKGFSIKLPNEWEKKENFMGAVIGALRPQVTSTEQFRESVNVMVDELPKAMTLEDYNQFNLSDMRKYMNEFKINESGQITINTNNANWFVYSFRGDRLRLKALCYILVKNRRGYAITFAATPETFSKYRRIFEEIAESFKFE